MEGAGEMNQFPLRIVTPDGLLYDGNAEELIVRTTSGDLGILTGHMNCVAPLGMGKATVLIDGKKRYAACIGGVLSMMDGKATLVATTFEWADSIDLKRVNRSEEQARAVLADPKSTDTELRLAQARLKRALIRKNVADRK